MLVGDGLDHARPHEHAVVGDGGKRTDQLDRRYGNPVTERDRSRVDARPLLVGHEQAGGFGRAVDSRFLAEAELTQGVVELLRPDPLADFDGADVARVLDDVLQGQQAVAVDVMHGVLADAIGAVFAVERRFGRQVGEFERGGGAEDLQRRSGLEGVGDGAIAPESLLGVVKGVRIECGGQREGQDFPGPRRHHDRDSGFGLGLLNGIGQGRFGRELNALIQRQHQVFAAGVFVRR